MPCRRGDRQTNSVDVDGVVGIRWITINWGTYIKYPGVQSYIYAKLMINSSQDGSFISEPTFYQRRSQTSYILHTCVLTLMVVSTCVDALHHAAFVARIGSGSSIKSSSTGYLRIPSTHTEYSPWNSAVTKTPMQVNSVRHHFPSFRLAQPSDAEVQTETSQSKVDDEEEWRTVLAAFKMYKAAYGDLKVPSRFVVPGMAPWPGETFVDLSLPISTRYS